MLYDIRHLEKYVEQCDGPIQSDEALFLYSLVRVIRPKVIVEFGFYLGHSAINFAKAIPENCKIYSFDSWNLAQEASKSIKDNRFKFIFKKQENFSPEDIAGNLIDILFIDASHNLEKNILSFKRTQKSFNDNALVVIHDTGTWNVKCQDRTFVRAPGSVHLGYFVNESEYIHQPDERKFVNYLKKYYPKFNQIHFHSLNTFRHGLTMLQKNEMLSLGKLKPSDCFETFLRIHNLYKEWTPLWILQKCLSCIEDFRRPNLTSIKKNYLNRGTKKNEI